jgi:16S rRNA G966 N2-methylase RsmD
LKLVYAANGTLDVNNPSFIFLDKPFFANIKPKRIKIKAATQNKVLSSKPSISPQNQNKKSWLI